MSDLLLALWFALIGGDRIDFAGGHGPFVLTPFLALTPLVALAELVRRYREGRPVAFTRGALAYAVLGLGLSTIVLTSVYHAIEVPVSAARTVLLVATIAGTFLVALLCADRPDLPRILARGAMIGIVLFAIFDLREALWFAGQGPELLRIGPMTARFDDLQTLGPIPRLAGVVADSNRAALVLLVYLVTLTLAPLRRSIRRGFVVVGLLLFAAAFSRSGMLAAVATLATATVARRRTISIPIVVGGLATIAALSIFLAVHPDVTRKIDAAANSPIASRLSTSEGSATSHLRLIERGLDEATKSVSGSLGGIGYGNAYMVLQDVFPANRYGNFHSLYVTMFAEAGIFALLITLAAMAGPLVGGGPWRPLIVGTWAFNLFYQTTTEPVFWFVLAMAWITIPRSLEIFARSRSENSGGPTVPVQGTVGGLSLKND